MARRIVTVLLVLTFFLTTFPQTASADFAKNVVDEGIFDRSLMGRVVYVWNGGPFDYLRAKVIDVDLDRHGVFVEFDGSGYRDWASTRQVYSEEQYGVASRAETAGAAAAIVGGLCLLFCPRSGSSTTRPTSPPSGRAITPFELRQHCYRECGSSGISDVDNYRYQTCRSRCDQKY